ncbi:hypothetical protein PM082_015205 [Marasmius tenuissimus]|nr:hypothetical protein PM082_015205 [Marasmius tenuissimus]
MDLPDSTPFTTAPSSGNQTPYDDFTPPEEGDIPEIPDEPTPSSSSAIHFSTGTGRRKMASSVPDEPLRRAINSFENLVALANSQETLRYVLANRKETWKGAKKMVWRDRGEPVVELADGGECLRWAVKGGVRAAGLAFNIRACFSLVLALLKIKNIPRKQRFALIRHAIFGADTWRFAAMLGTFVSLYKFLLNALPLYEPDRHKLEHTPAFLDDDDEVDQTLPMTSFDVPVPPTPGGPLYRRPQPPKRTERLSLSTQAQRILVRKKTKRWHAALAGAIAGGLAVMLEKRGRRITIAQQLFVRGLQGSYNSYTTKRNIHVPHGAVLVFSLVCGQILYAWLLRPGTLPRSYHQWVSNASKVPDPALRLNHDIVKLGKPNLKDFDDALELPDLTPTNASRLLHLRALFSAAASPSTLPPDQYLPTYGPCAAVHPAETSCFAVPAIRFYQVFKWMLPIYGALHLIPPVLFKWKTFTKDPLKVIARAIVGTGRSSTFLGVFVVIYQSINCFNHQLHEYLFTHVSKSKSTSALHSVIPKWLIDFILTSKFSFWVPGFLAGLALFIEEKRRRAELAMYVLPKGLEATWLMATGKVGLEHWGGRKGKVVGEAVLTAVGMAMVMSTYQNDPQHLSGLVRRILYQFVGPN